MTVKELKEAIKDVPDDLCVNMIERGGFEVSVDCVYVEEDNDGKEVLYISH